MAEFLLRDATRADGPAVRRVVFTVLEEYGLAPDPGGTDGDLEDVAASYVERGGVFRVIELEGEVVGCGGLFPVDASEAEIRKMYLLGPARGHGLGRRLLEELIAAARERGYRRVVLETASVLVEAIGLYRKRGFVPLEREHLPARCDQAYVLELVNPRARNEPEA